MKYCYDPKKDPNNDPYNDGGWWNIFQFKSNNNAGSQPIISIEPYVEDNKMYLGLIVKDFYNDDTDDYIQQFMVDANKIQVKINQWNHLEVYYKKSYNYNGKVIVWLNGLKIFKKDNIRTMLPADDTAIWGIGNYTDYISGGPIPGTATIYFDDAIVSKVKISDYINIFP